jgi:tetratricopeptide (TPR) repeat protein
MQSVTMLERGDPCLQIQVDLSAMVDGELDAPSVRRVMVHSDVCPHCRGFLEGIRSQARLHRSVHAANSYKDEGQDVATGAAAGLRQRLMENRGKLGRILYELGRGFVLMGLSPDFSREVSREPVPVPDMMQRGRILVAEVERWAVIQGVTVQGVADEWVAAKELFEHGSVRTPAENLAKGQRLLSECLALEPDHHEARIYLGLVHHVRGQRSLARRQFSQVLSCTDDRIMRAFAYLNLANVHLEEGDFGGAVQLLLQLVESGVVQVQPRFGMAYFNLALAYGLQSKFDDCYQWFRRLHDELPHKRAIIAKELRRRSQFVHLLRSNPEVELQLAQVFPSWFPLNAKEAC